MVCKVVIGEKGGKTHQFELDDAQTKFLIGKKIGDKIKGSHIGQDGYEFELTGGSDHCGFPMRKDVLGQSRKRILVTGGTGFRSKRKGLRVRKTMAGNTVHDKTAQVNLKVLKAGKSPLGGAPQEAKPEAQAPKEEKKADEKPSDAPAEEEKPKAKEKAEEKPAQDAPKEE